MRQRDGTEALNRARELRRDATEAEDRLWYRLRSRRLGDFKFRRQVWIGPFIADFLCMDAMLVVEVDGSQHIDDVAYDDDRTAFLATKGYRVIRVWNNDVMQRMDGVLAVILDGLTRVPSPSHASHGPLPLPVGERGK
ncbi:endonuclease domain-containing protein [Sphingomonas sp. NFX23]|uniref:endonuclease domain-containing protein n=1 Tax=Sphingomonas sp. NFX23 TaxID=2819532 RepID=UPI003CFB79AE